MKIYLVRHGESQGNIHKTYHGRMDFSLSQKGIEQGNALKKKLDAIIGKDGFQKVFTSSKKRTKETAEILGECSYKSLRELDERDFGIFEGMGYKEIMEKYPEEYKEWDEKWQVYRPEGGESHMDMCERVFQFMDSIGENSEKDDNVLVVTHGGVIRAMYCYVMDKNPELYWKFACDNCHLGIIRVEYGNYFIDTMMGV